MRNNTDAIEVYRSRLVQNYISNLKYDKEVDDKLKCLGQSGAHKKNAPLTGPKTALEQYSLRQISQQRPAPALKGRTDQLQQSLAFRPSVFAEAVEEVVEPEVPYKSLYGQTDLRVTELVVQRPQQGNNDSARHAQQYKRIKALMDETPAQKQPAASYVQKSLSQLKESVKTSARPFYKVLDDRNLPRDQEIDLIKQKSAYYKQKFEEEEQQREKQLLIEKQERQRQQTIFEKRAIRAEVERLQLEVARQSAREQQQIQFFKQKSRERELDTELQREREHQEFIQKAAEREILLQEMQRQINGRYLEPIPYFPESLNNSQISRFVQLDSNQTGQIESSDLIRRFPEWGLSVEDATGLLKMFAPHAISQSEFGDLDNFLQRLDAAFCSQKTCRLTRAQAADALSSFGLQPESAIEAIKLLQTSNCALLEPSTFALVAAQAWTRKK